MSMALAGDLLKIRDSCFGLLCYTIPTVCLQDEGIEVERCDFVAVSF